MAPFNQAGVREDGNVDAAAVQALSTPAGRRLLAGLPPYDVAQAPGLSDRLRAQGHDPALVAAALTQSRLRARAITKFGDRATTMLFTTDGLEQASRAPVARWHARRFADAGVEHVWDLGCGIGGDAVALCETGLAVTAIELDPLSAAVARANLAPWAGATVVQARAEDVELPSAPAQGQGCWLDPARRVGGVADHRGRRRRIVRLEEMSPSWDFVRSVAARMPAAGAKLGPGFPHAQLPAGCQAQWLSYGGEALECVLWWGELVERPGRAVVIHDGARWHTVPPQEGTSGSGPTRSLERAGVGPYLYDPDRALLAADRLDALCQAVQGHEVAPGCGYVTAERAVRTPLARCLRVLEVLPLQDKALRSWARRHEIGPLTLKKRGGGVDPEELRARIRPRGRRAATLVLTRQALASGSRAVAVWVEQV